MTERQKRVLAALLTSPSKAAAAEAAGVTINQMHMPYPVYVPAGEKQVNDYLRNEVAPKSMAVCAFLK